MQLVYEILLYACDKKLLSLSALNALVAIDNAAWLLYCRNNGIMAFDDMLPQEIQPALSFRNDSLASVPLIYFGMSMEEVLQIVDKGHFLI